MDNAKTPLPRAFHRFWAAVTVSSLGDGVYLAALPLLALSLTANPAIFGIMEAVNLLPWLLFGLIGGALVDRWDRRRVMVLADLFRFLLLVATIAAALAGMLSVPLLIALGFLLGIGGVLFETASMAYVPQLLGQDQRGLERANTRIQLSLRVSDGFVGPPIGSLLFAVGRVVPFVVDAVSFLVSSVLLRTLPPLPARPGREHGSILADAAAGASYLIRDKVLLGLAIRPAVGNFAFCGVAAILVLYAHETLHLNSAGYGAFLVTEAVGGVAGAFAAGWLSTRLGTGRALTLTAIVETIALLGLGLSTNPFAAGAWFVLLGAAMGATSTLGPSVRQAIVPDELMGRVGAASRLTALSAGPVGALAGGWLAHESGLRAPFFAGAGVLAVMVVITARLTSNRRIDAAVAAAARRRAAAEQPDPEH